jgi:ABC-type bacteriocin/lantibiotic exporter with double-glycine peptidase domain
MIPGLTRPVAFLLVAAVSWAASPAAVWIDVPFVHQPKEGCGAASIAMVMEYWAGQQGVAAGPDSDVTLIQRQLFSPREHGIPASKMEAYLRRQGFQTFALSGNWSDLEEQLRKGRPLIAALRPAGQREFHYVVVDGIDSTNALITMNDPALRKLLTRERAGFEKEWSATHNWMLLAVPAQSPR